MWPQAAGSVRKDATDGIGAPQVGLDPRYPSSARHWDDVKARYPGAAGAYAPCVDDYLQATQAIKQVAPLTLRPAWGKQINGAIQQAADLVSAGDKCMGQVQQGPSPTRAPSPNYGPIMTPVLAPLPPQQSVPPWNLAPAGPGMRIPPSSTLSERGSPRRTSAPPGTPRRRSMARV